METYIFIGFCLALVLVAYFQARNLTKKPF